ncbi:hypothetical protein L7F22_020290 [Adiantum nelumboides]|nr:hypothetical protein [Adiantum nelumboides]
MSSEPLLSPNGDTGEIKEKCSFDFPSSGGAFLLPQLSVVRKKELITSPSGAWRQTWIAKWGHRKVVGPFIVILQRGLEPKLLSLSAALGLTIGLFPICGITMVLCALAAVLLRSKCHVPTLMLGNLVASVFELGLLIPLMRVGEIVTGGEHFLISSSGLWEAIRGRQPPHALVFGMLHAVIGWSLVAPFCVAVLYIVFLPIFQYLTAKFSGEKRMLQKYSSCQDNSSASTGGCA